MNEKRAELRKEEDIVLEKVKEYLQKYDTAYIQKQSFDYFIHHRLSKIVEEESVLLVPISKDEKYKIFFGQIFVERPYIIDENREIRYITPHEAIIRELTYSSPVSINIRTSHVKINEKGEEEEEKNIKEYFKVIIARIPIMVGTTQCNLYNKTNKQRQEAGECEFDEGGYFVIKGKERVLVAQERTNTNMVYVFPSKGKYIAEIRSLSEETGHSIFIQMKLNPKEEKEVLLHFPFLRKDVPLGYIFYGYEFTRDEVKKILYFYLGELTGDARVKTIIQYILLAFDRFTNKEEFLNYMCKLSIHNLSKESRKGYIHQILYTELFPHLGVETLKYQRGMFLGYMLSRLLAVYTSKRDFDDRDHIKNKRLEMSGFLLSELFRSLYKRFVRSLEPLLIKRCDILVVISRTNIITKGIMHCFLTGNWGFPKSSYIRTGVSQVLNRLSYNCHLSHLRRILIPIGKEGKNTKIRQVHPSQMGFICPHETPEGHCLDPFSTMIMVEKDTETVLIPMKDIKEKDNLFVTDLRTRKVLPTTASGIMFSQNTTLYHIKTKRRSIKCTGKHPFLIWEQNKRRMAWKNAEDLIPGFHHVAIFCGKYVSNHVTSICQRKSRLAGLLRGLEKIGSSYFILPSTIEKERLEADLKYIFRRETWTVKKGFLVLSEICVIEMEKLGQQIEEEENNDDDDKKWLKYLNGFFCCHDWTFQEETPLIKTYNSINEMKQYKKDIQFFKKIQHTFNQQNKGKEGRKKGIWNLVSYSGKHRSELSLFVQYSKREERFHFLQDIEPPFYCPSIEKQVLKEIELLSHDQEQCRLMIDIIKQKTIFGSYLFDWKEDDILFVPVLEIFTSHEMEYPYQVMDIGIQHKDHNFIANGFIVHNSSGIVKNMTNAVQHTYHIDCSFIRMILDQRSTICTSFETFFQTYEYQEKENKYYSIFLNGRLIGVSLEDEQEVLKDLLSLREKNILHFTVSISIVREEKIILIFSDEGRLLRPLWNMKKMPSSFKEIAHISVDELIRNNYLVLRDAYELEDKWIAVFPRDSDPLQHDYCEFHPSLISGLCVSLIPFVEHTHAPRVTYHSSMGKQSIGLFASNFQDRLDTVAHVLCSLERPIVRTHYDDIYHGHKLSSGTNLIVAICMSTGFNQEDSVIINKSAIDRGLFRSYVFKTIMVEEKRKTNYLSEIFCVPLASQQIKSYNYEKLDKNGIIKTGVFVGQGDVLVGRICVYSNKNKEEKTYKDTSVIVKSGEEGYIDRVYITTSSDGYKIIKIKLRSLKIPEIGDKVSSRSAQKGTIGMVYSQEDMPFSISGIVPDLLINPLCIPSRMTINQLIECISAKAAVLSGDFHYATAFSSYSFDCVEEISQKLSSHGFQRNGLETMMNGMTGEMFSSQIFIGPTYYHRLKHLVSAKIHARNHGSVQALTRQPMEGRSRDGGLRFGEMERDCMISHGVSRFLIERLFDMSDKFSIPVCSQCGVIPHNLVDPCYHCKQQSKLTKLHIPYACKLLFQELQAMGINILLFSS